MSGISQTDLANDSLDLLDLDPIDNIEGTDNKSRRMKRAYRRSVRAVSRIQNFNSGTHRMKSTQVASVPFGAAFKYYHSLPGDWIKIQTVEVDGVAVDYEREGRQFVSEFANVDLIYTRYITDPNLMDSLMMETVVHWMAYILAIPLTKSKSLKTEIRESLLFILKFAMTVDSQESSGRKIKGFDSFKKIRAGIDPRAIRLDTSSITGKY